MDKRLTDLEVKVAYLEKAHDELSEVVRELYAQVASLSRMVQGEQEAASAPEPRRTLEDEKPPHY